MTYVLGVTPGGSVDIYARGIQDALTQLNLIHGQTMLIDYKPGGAGIDDTTFALGGKLHRAYDAAGLGAFLQFDLSYAATR